MKELKTLEKYSKALKKELQKKLKTGLEINRTIYPVKSEGAVFEFVIDKVKKSKRVEKEYSSVNEIIINSDQSLIQGDIRNVSFGGTNIFMNKNKITIIKGENKKEEWSNKQIKKDLENILGDKR